MEVAAKVLLLGGPASRIAVADPSQVGQCRRAARRHSELAGFGPVAAGRAAIVATELANNLLRHAGGGEVLLQTLATSPPELEIAALDRGPGIANVEQSLRDGFSTGGSAGTGLGAVSRLSTMFDIYSQVDRGTAIVARIAGDESQVTRRSATALEFGAVCRALPPETECGDGWKLAFQGDTVAATVVDGLGHGPLAARAAACAIAAFAAAPFSNPVEILKRMDATLAAERGAAAACMVLRGRTAQFSYAGVGNISGRVAGLDGARGLVSHNGVLGMKLHKTQQFDYDWPGDARLVLHSDGVSARWNLSDYPGLLTRHCAVVAAVLYRDHGRIRDDATIVVLRKTA